METLPDSTENDQNFINIMGPEFNTMMEAHLIPNDSALGHLGQSEVELPQFGHYSQLQSNSISPSVTALTYSISLENASEMQDRIYSSNLTIATDISPGSIIQDQQIKSSQEVISHALISPQAHANSTIQNLSLSSPSIHQSSLSLSGSPISRDTTHVKQLHLDDDVSASNLSNEYSAVLGTVQSFDRAYNQDAVQYAPYGGNLLMNAPPLAQNTQLQHLERSLNPYLDDPRDAVLNQTYCMHSLKQENIDQSNGENIFFSQNGLERYGLPLEDSEQKYGQLSNAPSHLELQPALRLKGNKSALSVLTNAKKTNLPAASYLLPDLQSANYSSVDTRTLQQVYQQPSTVSPHCPIDVPIHGVYDDMSSRNVNSEANKNSMFAYPNYMSQEFPQTNQSVAIRPNIQEKNNRKTPARGAIRIKNKRPKAASPINIDGNSRRISSENNGVTERRRKSDNFNCGLCQMRCDSRSDLRKHLNEIHSDTGPEPADHPNKKYTCAVANCQFISYARSAYDDHIAVHIQDGYTPTGKYRQGKAKNDLMRHRYNKEEFHCISCIYCCTIEASFKRHMKNHERGLENIMTQSCPVCGDDFHDEPVLKEHMMTHRNGKFFLCDICQFNTVQLKKLIQHRRMHTGEKPHLCPFCHYRAARRDNLRSHVRRMHSKENMYSDTFTPKSMVFAEMNQGEAEVQGLQQQIVQLPLNQM